MTASPPPDAPIQQKIREEWLASRTEDIVEPGLPIIDPHHHIWDMPGERYLFDEFLKDVRGGHNITASVFIECHAMYRADGPEAMKPVGEAEFIAGLAAQSASGQYGPKKLCGAIVGSVDLALGDRVEPVLEALVAAGGGRFRGIRDRIAAHPDKVISKFGTPEGVLMADATRRAMAVIAKQGLTFDIWAFQTQIDEVLDACRKFPNLTIIIDHVGGPLGCAPYRERRAEMFAQWSKGIAELAKLPNVRIKISGFGMRYFGFDFHRNVLPPSSDELVEAWRPYFETCIEAFGPERSMFASNFPVDKASFGYSAMWNAFKKLSKSFSPTERNALFRETARRIYRFSDE
jgi:L-fuconolactonase